MMFMLVYIWQVEVMSTDIRATAQGLANTVCRLAGLAVPVLTELGKTNSNYMYVPMLVINTFCLFACYVLPETNGKQVPKSVADL